MLNTKMIRLEKQLPVQEDGCIQGNGSQTWVPGWGGFGRHC